MKTIQLLNLPTAASTGQERKCSEGSSVVVTKLEKSGKSSCGNRSSNGGRRKIAFSNDMDLYLTWKRSVIFEELRSCDAFYGYISRDDVQEVLVEEGDYLLRLSTTMLGKLVVSFKAGDKIHHIMLYHNFTGRYRALDVQFHSVQALLKHYSETKPRLFLIHFGSKLKKACCRSNFKKPITYSLEAFSSYSTSESESS
eukprot:Nk52_evm31s123 gene=Nk52_evmTU31s123